ncbi:Uracil DNA glycosylase superfamily protein [Methylobacterium phyllostachyos]|uniref:Uracil DNA glycosylase superfamily protein n=1 Tax=Methylobacterium phyllostachyos TaxID=582672 RepID=A0A1H0FAX0_9HYPH|nr:uracil-DNA glycosylase [Methylobacterium phyllostachyos]SDN91751.1 Uracil DNA glycosylase superfamily protein [Methylobacterium phyllostachyos]
MPAEPHAPKSLADPDALAARRALIEAPHIAPIRALAAQISAERAAPVPIPDPLDGGVGARMLLLLETPGPAVLCTGFVTRDSANGTAANLFRFLAEAKIPRADTLIWNAVPWLIHQAGALNRAPRRTEVLAAAPYLAPLLDLLPRLTVAVLAGRYAAEAEPAITALRPGLPVIRIPHPSPTYVCTSPAVPARIRWGLGEAAALLARATG